MKTQHELYRTWCMMLDRCYSRKASNYHRYGGRGIDVCRQWQESFDQFCADVGERPDGHQLDRIDNDAGYSPDNCRWVTPSQNCRNTRRTRWITSEVDGRTLPLAEWCEIAAERGQNPRTFSTRIQDGRALDDALNDPRYYRRQKTPAVQDAARIKS